MWECDEDFWCNMSNIRDRGLGGRDSRSPSEASSTTDSGSVVKTRLDGGVSPFCTDFLRHRRFGDRIELERKDFSVSSSFACSNLGALGGICASMCAAPLEAIHLVFDKSSRATGRTGTKGCWLRKSLALSRCDGWTDTHKAIFTHPLHVMSAGMN